MKRLHHPNIVQFVSGRKRAGVGWGWGWWGVGWGGVGGRSPLNTSFEGRMGGERKALTWQLNPSLGSPTHSMTPRPSLPCRWAPAASHQTSALSRSTSPAARSSSSSTAPPPSTQTTGGSCRWRWISHVAWWVALALAPQLHRLAARVLALVPPCRLHCMPCLPALTPRVCRRALAAELPPHLQAPHHPPRPQEPQPPGRQGPHRQSEFECRPGSCVLAR
jgi:hypothetical protein